MTNPDCDICQGRGQVLLTPFVSLGVLSYSSGPIASVNVENRQFPCPQCSAPAPDSHVVVVEANSVFRESELPIEHIRSHIQRELVRRLAERMYADGLISFEELEGISSNGRKRGLGLSRTCRLGDPVTRASDCCYPPGGIQIHQLIRLWQERSTGCVAAHRTR